MTVRAEPGTDSVRLAFILADTGAGMPQEFLSRLFDPFEQADTPAVDQSEGTGLGLAISQNLVRMMGGEIRVESEMGRGSKFEFEITLKISDESPDENTLSYKECDFFGKRILLAEDIELNRFIMRELFAETGVVIEEAENGLEAIQMFSSSTPHYYSMILMDIKMPQMDGCAATQSIRALDRPDAATVPIVAMSADAYRDDVENALQSGMNAHLAKPIDIEKCLCTLTRYLCGPQSPQTPNKGG